MLENRSVPAFDNALIRLQFPALSRTDRGHTLAYFDGPGGSQVPQCVIEAISEYYRMRNANTHGAFITSRESDQMMDDARRTVATFLNAPSPDTISFGANMTSLNFMLSRAIGRMLVPGDEVLITQLDHEANRGPWLALRESGIEVREVRMLASGSLDYEDFSDKINERTRLVALGWASNALGTVNDIPLARKLTQDVGALLLVDAVHFAPHFAIDVMEHAVDFLLCSAYKFYGPHVGILYSRPNLLDQLQTDRLLTQDARAPYRIETGTLNHAAIAGVKAAVDFIASLGDGSTARERVVSAMESISDHEKVLANRLYDALKRNSKADIFGPGFHVQRAPTVSFTLDGISPNQVATQLAEQGILVWDGDFYAARAVEILGLSTRGGLVRVGMSVYTAPEEVDRLIEEIERISAE